MIGLTLPATRGKQGERVFYVVTVPNSVLNNFFTINMDPPEEKSQRQLDPRHAHDIRDYILESPSDYVIPTLVYAVDRDCPFKDSKDSDSVGLLTIPFGTNLRSLDGQHRRQGLNEAIAENPFIAEDYTSVLIYVEPDVDKRRQMFSDMNATPKVVSKALNVYFDRRSPFARAAQALAEQHPFLSGHVDMQAARISAGSEKWFSLGTIFDVMKRLQVGPTGRVRLEHRFLEEGVQERGGRFFELLGDARDEFDDVAAGRADLTVLRQRNILFSGTTLRALAGAVYILIEHDPDRDMTPFADGLRTVDFRPQAEIWRRTGFVSPGRTTPNARNQEVLAATRALAKAMENPAA
ncbi:MAG TPA: DNA sulfur modification protein DndB [Patescibacteria group bacterium]|nr:DNA sulfur modification protein DndB [Patescibacteria group bacterium]